jgi:hypothetical protein
MQIRNSKTHKLEISSSLLKVAIFVSEGRTNLYRPTFKRDTRHRMFNKCDLMRILLTRKLTRYLYQGRIAQSA